LLLKVAIHVQLWPLLEQLSTLKLVGLTESINCVEQLQETLTGCAPPVKVKVPFMQSLAGILIEIVVDPPGTSGPVEGLKVTPFRSLDADQFKSPWAFPASLTASLHVQLPSLFGWQLVLLRLAILTDKAGAPQLHGTETVFPPVNRKLSVRFTGQTVSDTVIVTCTGWPGVSVPLDGLNCTLQHPPTLANVDQLPAGSPGDFSESVAIHVQP
jgi:hypothetical protein